MCYATFLVHLDADGDCSHRIGYALGLAKEFDTYLIGFAACAVRPIIGTVPGMPVDGDYFGRQAKDNQDRLKELKQQFLSVVGDDRRGSWRQAETLPTDALTMNARAADLIISGTPHGASSDDVHRLADPGLLLGSAGRPVLFAAEDGGFQRPQKIVVGWKDTTEARRAVSGAMPLLKLATDVLVVTTGSKTDPGGEDSLADVVRFLTRHGVSAQSRHVEADDGDYDRFAGIAADEGADLVVSGAYGHHRTREWIFGGFTRNLLDDGRFNRLMAG